MQHYVQRARGRINNLLSICEGMHLPPDFPAPYPSTYILEQTINSVFTSRPLYHTCYCDRIKLTEYLFYTYPCGLYAYEHRHDRPLTESDQLAAAADCMMPVLG